MSKNGIELIVEDGVLTGYESKDPIVAVVPEGSPEAERKEAGVLVLPAEIKSIGDNVFSNVKTLEKVVLPPTVETIGDRAFAYCSSLESVDIASSVTSIGGYAFSGCDKLTICCEADSKPEGWCLQWNLDGRPAAWGFAGKTGTFGGFAFAVCRSKGGGRHAVITGCSGSLPDIAVPGSVTLGGESFPVGGIADYAFHGHASFESVFIPTSVTSIGNSAFSHCSSLESITIPSGIDYIGKGLFSGCRRLREVNAHSENGRVMSNAEGTMLLYSRPGSLELRWGRADKTGLLVVPEGVTSISRSAFYLDRRIRKLVLPGTLETIEDNAFNGCTKLEKIIFCEGLKEIGSQAFFYCESLKKVTLPESLEAVRERAFFGCSSLKEAEVARFLRIETMAFDISTTAIIGRKGPLED